MEQNTKFRSSCALLKPAHRESVALADMLTPHDVEYGKSLLPDAPLPSGSRRGQDELESRNAC